MGLDRSILERQLAHAQSELAACESALSASGAEQGQFQRHPQWRNLNARRRQIATRLRSAGKIEKRNADLETRRAAKASDEGETDRNKTSKDAGEARGKQASRRVKPPKP